MNNKKDFLDSLTEADIDPDSVPAEKRGGWMAVSPRFTTSAELEEAEREYLATTWLPIPFVDEQGQLEPLHAADKATLRSLGITEEEYEQLIGVQHAE